MARSVKVVGVLIETSFDNYQQALIRGMRRRAAADGIQLHIFDCNSSDQNSGSSGFKDSVFRLVEQSRLDGLIVFTGALINQGSSGEFVSMLDLFSGIPRVSLSIALDGIHSIVIDNFRASKELISHLINDHGYRRIAYVCGPLANQEALDRFAAYRECLSEAGLPYDPELVFSGDFDKASGIEAMNRLLESGRDFDAVAAADDVMALGSLEVLQSRGFNVPAKTALVGFDDIDLASCTSPPLTTMRQPVFEMGETAVDIISNLLAGKEQPPITLIEPAFVRRQSCGCDSSASIPRFPDIETVQDLIVALKRSILKNDEHQEALAFSRDIETVVSLFFSHAEAAAGGNSKGEATRPGGSAFDFSGLDLAPAARAFRSGFDQDASLSVWEEILVQCRNHAYLAGSEAVARELFNKYLIDLYRSSYEYSHNAMLLRRYNSTIIDRLGESLLNTFSHEAIKNLLAEGCAANGIRCSISLFDESRTNARIYFCWDGERMRDLEGALLPVEACLSGSRSCALCGAVLTMPLHKDRVLAGFACFAIDAFKIDDYANLADRISRAIEGANLVEQLNRHTQNLERLVDERTAELREANRKLLDRSYTDELSGLKNRRFLKDIVEPDARRLMATFKYRVEQRDKRRDESQNSHFGILLVDIDHFKDVNDRYGHDTGDGVIRKISDILTRSVRETDPTVRYGGEEFVLVLKNLDRDYLLVIAEKIRSRVADEPFLSSNGERFSVTCSVGGTCFPVLESKADCLGFWDTITLADLCLYYAKEHGRNMSVILEANETWIEAGCPSMHNSADLERSLSFGYVRLLAKRGRAVT